MSHCADFRSFTLIQGLKSHLESSEEVKNLEAIIKVNLSQEYIDLLNGMNGAYIQGNIFDMPGG